MCQASQTPSWVEGWLTEFDSSCAHGHLSCVQTTYPDHSRGRVVLPPPGAATGPGGPTPHCQPPWRGRQLETGAGCPWPNPSPLCFTSLPLCLRCGPCLLDEVALFKPLVGSCVWGLFGGPAALGHRPWPGQDISQQGPEELPRLQPESNVRTGQRCFTLLGITCLFF